MIRLSVFLLLLAFRISFPNRTPVEAKINGVNFVAPPRQVGDACMLPVKQVNAGWVALNPYAFGRKGQPDIIYNAERQWWGEKMEGVKACVAHARKQQLKVMIKPHVWVQGEGWAGDFTLSNEADVIVGKVGQDKKQTEPEENGDYEGHPYVFCFANQSKKKGVGEKQETVQANESRKIGAGSEVAKTYVRC